MKEFNKPEPEVIEKPKPAKERPYIALQVAEINKLSDNYREAIKFESGPFKDTLIEKIKELERELKRRSIKS